jgi:peptidoglycan hydrolase CwlO-like protein
MTDILELQIQLNDISKKIESLETTMMKCTSSCENMDRHISFIESTLNKLEQYIPRLMRPVQLNTLGYTENTETDKQSDFYNIV